MAIGVPYNGTPTIYRNVVVIGANVNEVPQGPPGNPRAYDARTGGSCGNSRPFRSRARSQRDLGRRLEGSLRHQHVGLLGDVDAERGIVYLPIAGPAANYYGGDRPGNNLYANSIVAVDAETGAYKWHFQTVHHDIWDADMPSVGRWST